MFVNRCYQRCNVIFLGFTAQSSNETLIARIYANSWSNSDSEYVHQQHLSHPSMSPRPMAHTQLLFPSTMSCPIFCVYSTNLQMCVHVLPYLVPLMLPYGPLSCYPMSSHTV